jgi:catechol 2,3-dioxygenase-like lactoylglutathione lyase family enzyme
MTTEQQEEAVMTKAVRDTKITDVAAVAVPVSDQDRALAFYVGTLGFEVRLDVPMSDGGRWIQVARPGAKIPVALVKAGNGAPTGVDTGITFGTPDADAAHAVLAECGVDVDELLRWPGVPTMFIFRDGDGNQLKVIETV